MLTTEHPFAEYIRILGKGQKGSRGLTQTEARTAMGLLLDGAIEDVQLGAFLMLLRTRKKRRKNWPVLPQRCKSGCRHLKISVDLDCLPKTQLPVFVSSSRRWRSLV